MKYLRKLPNSEKIKKEYPLDEKHERLRNEVLQELKAILDGTSAKKLIIVGPCSADRGDAVLEYVKRLSKLQEEVKDHFLLVPRVYTAKPRTNGLGYKGLLHRPYAASENDDIVSGIIAMRKLHRHIICDTGMFPADELLYPQIYRYVSDLLVYLAVGARSVEDQEHRLTASGVNVPVGMKNPTSGNLSVMLNAISAAQAAQRIIFGEWEAETEGNPYAHAILRGYTDSTGETNSNYYYESLIKLHDHYYKSNLKNPAVIVDCNHANSGKRYQEQPRIAENVMDSCKRNAGLNRFVKGLMIESYLEDGAQMIGEGIYGKSITDPCLGWEKTQLLVRQLADKI